MAPDTPVFACIIYDDTCTLTVGFIVKFRHHIKVLLYFPLGSFCRDYKFMTSVFRINHYFPHKCVIKNTFIGVILNVRFHTNSTCIFQKLFERLSDE